MREHFDQKTKRSASYRHAGKRLSGFNSIFATASIDAAKRYYTEFANRQKDIPPAQRLKIGLIYGFAVNEGMWMDCWARRNSRPKDWIRDRAISLKVRSVTTTACSPPMAGLHGGEESQGTGSHHHRREP
ncbi:type I restriction enzyme subunit R domain-containing protein [Aminobacter sp. HY435]|uniref:type I restriction enzyme subunit R domain-containing protein n=1 Tax=Aminobacter sp. HY435 TaxID=2970917 RepID=UPI003FA4BCBF